MLGVTAYDLAARMRYKGLSLEEAAAETILHLTKIGGEGGLIAVDPRKRRPAVQFGWNVPGIRNRLRPGHTDLQIKAQELVTVTP